MGNEELDSDHQSMLIGTPVSVHGWSHSPDVDGIYEGIVISININLGECLNSILGLD